MQEKQALKILAAIVVCNNHFQSSCAICPLCHECVSNNHSVPWTEEDARAAYEWAINRINAPDMSPAAESAAEDKAEQPRGDWREWILTTARNAVCTDRNKKYGEPENSFAAIGMLWTAYLQASGKMDAGENIYDNDAALMLAMFKIAREITAISPNPDSYADIAGYAACAGECALNGDGQTLINPEPPKAEDPEEDPEKYSIFYGTYDKFMRSEIETRKE